MATTSSQQTKQKDGVENKAYIDDAYFIEVSKSTTETDPTIATLPVDLIGYKRKTITKEEQQSYVSSGTLGIDLEEERHGVEMGEAHEDRDEEGEREKKNGLKKIEIQRRTFTVSYETILWTVFTIVTILCVVDRFVDSGDIVLNRKGKKVSRLWGEHLGQTITNVIWAITARLIITSQNLMFYTTLWCLPNMITEVAPRFIEIVGIRDVHIKAHRIAGIFLIGIPSLAHVLVIFLPPLVDRTELTYSPPSSFNYSNQPGHLNWTKWWDPAAVNNWSFNDKLGVHLTSDEIYRFTLMIILFCLLFPLSRSGYLNNRSYSLAIGIHAFAGIWYAIDNIRKITHGLAHVMNLPLLLFWCLDRLLSIALYRRHKCSIVRKEIISNSKYIILHVKADANFKKTIGDVYYLSIASTFRQMLSWERAHPFTSFSNYSKDESWDYGFVISVMEDDAQWFPSWTRRLHNIETSNSLENIKSWGPYRTSCLQLFKQLKENKESSYVLFASGSGFGYLLDALSFLTYKAEDREGAEVPNIDIYYTVSCGEFVKSFRLKIQYLVSQVVLSGSANVRFHWHVTGQQDFEHDRDRDRNITYNAGRINFNKIIMALPKLSPVYFVGRPSLADHIDDVCKKYNICLVKDFTNSQRGSSDKSLMLSYIKKTLLVISLTIGACIVLSIYLDVGKIKNLT